MNREDFKKGLRRILIAGAATTLSVSSTTGCTSENDKKIKIEAMENSEEKIKKEEEFINKIKLQIEENAGEQESIYNEQYLKKWYEECEKLVTKAREDNNYEVLIALIDQSLSDKSMNRMPEWMDEDRYETEESKSRALVEVLKFLMYNNIKDKIKDNSKSNMEYYLDYDRLDMEKIEKYVLDLLQKGALKEMNNLGMSSAYNPYFYWALQDTGDYNDRVYLAMDIVGFGAAELDGIDLSGCTSTMDYYAKLANGITYAHSKDEYICAIASALIAAQAAYNSEFNILVEEVGKQYNKEKVRMDTGNGKEAVIDMSGVGERG